MTTLPENPTGPECVAALRAACPPDQRFNDFLRPLWLNPKSRIAALEDAGRPSRDAADRIRAFLEGRPVPPPRPYIRSHTASRCERDPVPFLPKELHYTHREPCFRCGTRADIGCRHQPRDCAA